MRYPFPMRYPISMILAYLNAPFIRLLDDVLRWHLLKIDSSILVRQPTSLERRSVRAKITFAYRGQHRNLAIVLLIPPATLTH